MKRAVVCTAIIAGLCLCVGCSTPNGTSSSKGQEKEVETSDGQQDPVDSKLGQPTP